MTARAESQGAGIVVVLCLASAVLWLLIELLLGLDQVGLAGVLAAIITGVWGIAFGHWLAREG